MKKKLLNSMRMFLVAAGLLVGGNAWAQTTTTLMEYGTNDVAWTAEGLATWTVPENATYLTSGFDNATTPTYFTIATIATYNSGYEVSKSIAPTSGNIINLTAVWRGRSNTGRYFSNSNGSYFRFGNIVVAQNDQDQKHGYVLTGLTNLSSATTFTAGSYRVDITSGAWLKIEAEINTATNTLTSFTVKSEDGATTYVNLSNQALTTYDYTTIGLGYKKGSSVTTSPNGVQLKSIKITETTQSVSYADYTVHFVDGDGAKVKEDVVRNGEVGATVNANSDDMTTYYTSDYKYVYNNDGGGVEVVAGGTSELTITYDKYGKYTATASAVSGGTTLQSNIASVTTYVGESATIQLNKYIKIGDVWYSTTNCYVDVTEAGDNEVTYTATDIDYFYEFESLTGGRTDESDKSYSGGIRSRVNKSNSLTTAEEINGGVYTLTVPYYNSNNSAGKLYIYTVVGGIETDTELTIDAPKGSGTVTKTVTIPNGGALRFKNTDGTYTDNSRIDYITLKCVNVSATLPSSGFGSLASAYGLDFSAVEGLTAYAVTAANSGTVTLTAVDELPANSGVILKGTAGATYSIPVKAAAAYDGTNLLGAAVSAFNCDANDVYILQGGKFHLVTAASTVPAGKAYLPATSVPSGAHALSFVFGDDETTGINNVNVNHNDNWYDLQGRRVAAPQKGLYIVNGKKVIIK